MDLRNIALRVAAGPTFVGEPDVPLDKFKDAYSRSAQRAEDEAYAASETAADGDAAAHKECVKLFQTAKKAWKDATEPDRAAQMQHMAWEHDQILKSLTGETFGIPKVYG